MEGWGLTGRFRFYFWWVARGDMERGLAGVQEVCGGWSGIRRVKGSWPEGSRLDNVVGVRPPFSIHFESR